MHGVVVDAVVFMKPRPAPVCKFCPVLSGDPCGYQPLREHIAEYLRITRAMHCEAEQVIIVSGCQQALYLTASVLLNPGDAVWMEDSGYLGARSVLQSADAELVPVPVDEQGDRQSNLFVKLSSGSWKEGDWHKYSHQHERTCNDGSK